MNVKKTGEQLSEISVTGPGININVKQGLIIPITTNGSYCNLADGFIFSQ